MFRRRRDRAASWDSRVSAVRLWVWAAALFPIACAQLPTLPLVPGSGGSGGGGAGVIAEATTKAGVVIRVTIPAEVASTLPALSLVAHDADEVIPGGLTSSTDWAEIVPAGVEFGGPVTVTFDLSALEIDLSTIAAGFASSEQFATQYSRVTKDEVVAKVRFEVSQSGAVGLADCPTLLAHARADVDQLGKTIDPDQIAGFLSRLAAGTTGLVETAVPLSNDQQGCLDALTLQEMLSSSATVIRKASDEAVDGFTADPAQTEWFELLLDAYDSAKRLEGAAQKISIVRVDGVPLLPDAPAIAAPLVETVTTAAIDALPAIAEAAGQLCDVGEAESGAALLVRAQQLAESEEVDLLTRQRLSDALSGCLSLQVEMPADLTAGARVAVQVTALDAFSRPLVGIAVRMAATGGTINPPAARTDAQGQVNATFLAGAVAGPFTLSVDLIDDRGRTLAQTAFEGTVGGAGGNQLLGQWQGSVGLFKVTEPPDAPFVEVFGPPRALGITIAKTEQQGVVLVTFDFAFEALDQRFISARMVTADSLTATFDRGTAATSCLEGGYFRAELQADGALRGFVGCNNSPLGTEERFLVRRVDGP